jgi:hypothetical protein
MTVPSMGDVRGETKAFLEADHVAVALFNIAKLFYGDEIGPRWFASLHKLASEKYGDNDGFTKFLKAALPFLQFVRNARNAVEHPDQAKSVKVTDIALLPSGELNPPSIEVIHPDTPQPSVPLLALMEAYCRPARYSFRGHAGASLRCECPALRGNATWRYRV